MAASSPISMRQQQQMHRPSGSNNLNMNQPGQGPYRMSFSPNDREYHQQQSANASTYSGIVGNAARTIFGSSDDEGYLPTHPNSMDSRVYSEHQQQQYLAHERLASIAERAAQQPGPLPTSGNMQPPNGLNHHQYTPLMQSRPSVPPFPMEIQTGVYSGGGLPSPIQPSPLGGNHNWPTVAPPKRV